MQRPTVLHVARDWVRPSERFVADLVGTATATRSVVACGQRWPGIADSVAVPVHELQRLAPAYSARPRDRRVTRAALLGIAVVERAKLLHAHFGYWAAHAGRTAARLRRPWVLSLHGHDLLVEDPTSPERDVLRTADLVAVPSGFLAEIAVQAGFDEDRVQVLPSGIDLARFPWVPRRMRSDQVVVTFAGRFVAKKGVIETAEALARASRRIPGLRAVFVGSGPLEPRLRSVLAESGLDADIRSGDDPDAVRAALGATDIAVVASRTAQDGDAETLGLVAIEAQACGVPLVATRHGGLVESVNADAAVFAEGTDAPALEAAVLALIDRAAGWPTMGRAGRDHVRRHFELGACTAAVEAAYRELLHRHSSARGLRSAVARGATGGTVKPEPKRAAPVTPDPDPADGAAVAAPQVSVVMVTHNRRALCARSVAAIRAQTYPAFDVVVVDNASTDGTAEDLRSVTAEDSRIRVIRTDQHWPPAVARNRAVSTARARAPGDIVAFTDDDCFPTPTWLEALVAGLGRDSSLGLVQGRTVADPQGWLRPLSRTQWTPAEYGVYETANIAYRRASLGDQPFDEEFARVVADVLGPRIGKHPFGEDTELAWRVKRSGAGSAFSATAVVHHHVYDPDVRYLLKRAVVAAGFPVVVRRVPELRGVFLWQWVFLGRRHAALLVAVGGAGLARRRPVAGGALVVPYLHELLRPRSPGRRGRLAAAPVLIARDAVELLALVYGSARARSVVL